MDISIDGHFATVLVGIGHLDNREITLANAGHLKPLIISAGGAHYAETEVGVPLGVAPSSYTPLTFRMPAASTLVCFTDGLVERRGESIDEGLQRLAAAATNPDPSVATLVTRLVDELTADGSEDDVAILAFRWADQSAEAAESDGITAKSASAAVG